MAANELEVTINLGDLAEVKARIETMLDSTRTTAMALSDSTIFIFSESRKLFLQFLNRANMPASSWFQLTKIELFSILFKVCT